jgi:lysophospholipase L1-like esterase
MEEKTMKKIIILLVVLLGIVALLCSCECKHVDYSEASCTKPSTCLDCGETISGALGHTDGEWIIDKEANCTEDGSKHQICSVCEMTIKTELLAKSGHIEVIDKAVEATCTTDGKTEGKHCSVCNTVTLAQTTVKAKGHIEVIDKAVAATYTTEGKTEGKHCALCNTILVAQTIINATQRDVEYTYDGNNESDAHTWASCANGARSFVKIADIPEGELDLIGGKVSVRVPEYPHLDYTFTVTSEMYREVSGLTQILYQDEASNDHSPNAMIVICDRIGSYNVALNGWEESIRFAETGIYFMDNRANWGGKYVESLFCSGESSSGKNEESPVEYSGNEIQIFTRGLCIGDSITEGVFNHNDGQIPIKKYSYPSVLKRITGIEIVNAGVGGLTSKTWYEVSLNSDKQWGKWVNNEWVWNVSPETSEGDVVSTELDYSGFDFSIIHLGINDIYLMSEGTLDQTIQTFETNIHNIISKLKTANTGIKVFLCTIIPRYAYPGNTDYAAINEKIREIANETEDVFLIDLNAYSECVEGTPYCYNHLTALGYHKLATEIKSLISYTIKTSLDDFQDVQFIGTEYDIAIP